MELSKRLTAVAGLVTEGASVADIGTDHGYVPIYLVKKGICPKAIAMDVNRGPLERARMHIIGNKLKYRIQTRLSDGLKEIKSGEADCMIAAGMGGGLVIKILTEGREVLDSFKECILQPQSEIDKVRKYLNNNGFVIIQEDMVEEDYKFYPMMKAVHGIPEQYEEYEYMYGKRLLEKKHPVLKKYLLKELDIQESIIRQLLQRKDSESAKERFAEIQKKTELIRQALACYEEKQPE